MSNIEKTTYDKWPEQLRLKRGLLNGKRVQLARESRGIRRFELARKVGISTVDLVQLEMGWGFWGPSAQEKLVLLTDFPIAFFVRDDPPTFDAPIFFSGTDANGDSWCHVDREVRE